eukprot:390148-Amphidinium_carterae.2
MARLPAPCLTVAVSAHILRPQDSQFTWGVAPDAQQPCETCEYDFRGRRTLRQIGFLYISFVFDTHTLCSKRGGRARMLPAVLTAAATGSGGGGVDSALRQSEQDLDHIARPSSICNWSKSSAGQCSGHLCNMPCSFGGGSCHPPKRHEGRGRDTS